MNVVENYSQIIEKVLTEYLAVPYTYDRINYRVIISKNRQDYLIMIRGLHIKSKHNSNRIYDCIAHLEIKDEKIVIYRDKIKYGITGLLVDLGIPQNKIELFSSEKQFPTEYVLNFKKIYDRNKTFFTSESTFEKIIINLNATSTELTKIAAIEHRNIAKAIAKHPNTSPDLLVNLFSKFPVEVLTNPSINLLLLEQPKFLEELYNSFTDIFIQDNIEIPSFFREWAVNHELEDVRFNVVQSLTLPHYCLEKLLQDESCLVVQELYKNPILDLDFKQRLNARRLLLQKNCPYKLNNNCVCN